MKGPWGLLPLCFTATWFPHSYADNALRQESCAQDLKQLLKAQQGLTLRTAVRGGLVCSDPEPQERGLCKEWTVSLLAEQDGPGPMSYKGLLHGVCPTEAGFSFLATPILQERFCSPASMPPGTLKRIYSYSFPRLLAFTCRCAKETKMPCLGSLLQCIGGWSCSIAGNLRWFYFKM